MSQSIKCIQAIFLLLLVMATSACSAISTEENKDNVATQDNSLEVIYGFDIQNNGSRNPSDCSFTITKLKNQIESKNYLYLQFE